MFANHQTILHTFTGSKMDTLCFIQLTCTVNSLLSFFLSAIIDLIDENGNLCNLHLAKKDEHVGPRFEARTNYIPVLIESKMFLLLLWFCYTYLP